MQNSLIKLSETATTIHESNTIPSIVYNPVSRSLPDTFTGRTRGPIGSKWPS